MKKFILVVLSAALASCSDTADNNTEINQIKVAQKGNVASAPAFTQDESIYYSKQTVEQPRRVAGLSTSSTKISTVLPALDSGVSVAMDFSRSSNRFGKSEAESKISNDLEAVVTYAFTNGISASLVTSISQDVSGNGDTTLGDSTLVANFPATDINRDNSVQISTRLHLPTSDASYEDASLRAAASARATLTTKKQAFTKPLTITSFVDGLKYSHKFQTNAKSEENLSHRGRAYLGLNLEATEKVAIGVEGYYQAGESYQGTLKTKFLLAQKLSYKVAESLSIYASHTNDGNALGPNGEDSNIDAFDSKTSVMGAGVTATF